MAKFNVTVELDWIEENGEYNIDDELKRAVAEAITKQVMANAENAAKQFDELVAKKVHEIGDEKLNAIMDEFLNKERVITDRWGDPKETGSVIDLLKKKCDAFMEEQVNKNGRHDPYDRDKKSRLEWVIHNNIEEHLKKAVDQAADHIGVAMKKYVDETVKAKIGDNIAKVIGLETITQRIGSEQ